LKEERYMKKIITLLLAMAMLFALAACGATATATTATPAPATEAPATENPYAGKTIDELAAEITPVNPGYLTVGTSADFAPYEFWLPDANGNLQMVGFDVSLAQAIADALGLTLDMKSMSFDSILIELASGNIDLAIAGFSPTPERAQSVDFSDLYYMGGQCLMIRAADADKYTSFDSLKGLPVGAQTGSIQYGLAEDNTPDSDIVGLQDVTSIIMELKTGKLEAAFMETAVAEAYIKTNPDLAVAFDVEYTDAEGSAVAIRKGNDALTAAVNLVIAQVLADGTMNDAIATANEQAADPGMQQITVE
jgi:polar amino acid transport system substrate-binding protein